MRHHLCANSGWSIEAHRAWAENGTPDRIEGLTQRLVTQRQAILPLAGRCHIEHSYPFTLRTAETHAIVPPARRASPGGRAEVCLDQRVELGALLR